MQLKEDAIMRRLVQLLRRRKVARRFGVDFSRSKYFMVPESLLFAGRKVPLAFPNEVGMKTAFIDIFLDDCYRLSDLTTFGITPKRIIDVGANVGFFSIAARIAFPHSIIHAYEPNSNLKRYYDANSQEFEFDCFPFAIGNVDGLCDLDCNKDSVLTRTVDSTTGKIRVLSFESALHRIGTPVDLLKLDCEGAEWAILESPSILSDVLAITLEYHLDDYHGHAYATQLLESAGFRIDKQFPAHGNAGIALAIRT